MTHGLRRSLEPRRGRSLISLVGHIGRRGDTRGAGDNPWDNLSGSLGLEYYVIPFAGLINFNYSRSKNGSSADPRGCIKPFTPKIAKFKTEEKILNFILRNCQKQTAPLESTLQ